jgi:hypothetical protein
MIAEVPAHLTRLVGDLRIDWRMFDGSDAVDMVSP